MRAEAGNALEADRFDRLEEAQAYYLFQPGLLSRVRKLSRRKLWMSDPVRFNDPLDLRLDIKDLSYRGPFDDEARLREAMRGLLKDNPDAGWHWFYNERLLNSVKDWIDGTVQTRMLIDAIKERFREFGVTCLTPLWNHGLMWSHYADGHMGYCVEYCVKEMTLTLKNGGMFSPYHVQYSSRLPELCVSETLFAPHQTLGRMLATKSAEWEYEQELRLVHLEKKAAYVDMPVGMEVSALIAGLRAKTKLVQKLIEKAADLKVPAYRVRLRGYELEMELL